MNKRWVVTLLGLLMAVVSVTPVVATQPDSFQVAVSYQESFRRVAQSALPVVVRIDVANEMNRSGLGSGVLVRRAGDQVYVLTNEHVVGDASEITVALNDGREFDAILVGKDANSDLALVAFQTSEEVPIATLGDSDQLQVGDWAFAVGNPLGFESTVTAGIVSALGRRSTPGSGIAGLTDYIQTDAAVNQGNSGGALVNLNGEVVGINSWIASRSGGSIGLGFAIPINRAKRAINEFIAFGEIEYGWLGITYGGRLTDDLATSLRLENDEGALVGSVFTGSPAEGAGIQPGDVIAEIDGEPIEDWSELLTVVADLRPGSSTAFAVLRENGRLETRVEIARRDDETQRAESWPGLTVLPLTDEIREGLSLRNEPGTIVIAGVEPASPASEAGLRQGDIIRRIGAERIDDLAEFYSVLNARRNRALPFRIAREGREFSIRVDR